MVGKRYWVVLGGGLGLYLLVLGFLGGILAERIRFDQQRTEILNRYDHAVQQWQAYLMSLEHAAWAGSEPADSPWAVHLRAVHKALARHDVGGAEQAWHEAYGVALRSRRWEGMIEVGDAHLRIGETANGPKAAQAQARRLYLAALFRARQEDSLEGVLRAAEAFAALGDRDVVEQCLRIAQSVAGQNQEGQARVQALRDRLASPGSRGYRPVPASVPR